MVEIAWDMLLLSPPAIAGCPKRFSRSWHKECYLWWDYKSPPDLLIYFRPLLMKGIGGTVETYALVGNMNPARKEVHLCFILCCFTLTQLFSRNAHKKFCQPSIFLTIPA